MRTEHVLGRTVLVAGSASLVAVAVAALRQRPWLARVLARQSTVVFAVRTRHRAVAITLDDGPDDTLTPKVLEVLARHGARATFFFLGSGVERHPDIARTAVREGHEIGNHGWLDRAAVRLSPREFDADVSRTGQAIHAATGQHPCVLRPGSGWLRPAQLRLVRASGNQVVLGSIAVVDLAVLDVEKSVRFILGRLRPGAIIVLHEGRSDRADVVTLLDRLLPEVNRLGYETLTVTDLLASRE